MSAAATITRLRSSYTVADVDLIAGDQVQDRRGIWRTILAVLPAERPGRVWVLDITGLSTCEWAVDFTSDAIDNAA